MVFQRIDRISRRIGSQLESLNVRSATFQSDFCFGDATGFCFGAADSNAGLNNQAAFNLVGVTSAAAIAKSPARRLNS
jgi:hypothetical protein